MGFPRPAMASSPPWNLTPLAEPPDWSELDRFQHTVSASVFEDELIRNYLSDPEDAKTLIEVREDHALIVRRMRDPDRTYRLEFSGPDATMPPAYWRAPGELPPLTTRERPLEGMRILIDPGHLGGRWARMEQRWFLMPEPPGEGPAEDVPAPKPRPSERKDPPARPVHRPVKEGEIVLRVAELLEEKLTRLGARVALVRRQLEPVTDLRPADFTDQVRDRYGLPDSATAKTNALLRRSSERLFYLSSEIRARGRRVNEEFRPDLALCLHVNAETWGDPDRPSFVEKNHFHLLINGCYSRSEVLKDDQRHDLVRRILLRTHPTELALAETIAEVMAPILDLPPYVYTGSNAKRISSNPYVWSRNLLATRIYYCPVIFFEPYVMNHEVTHARIQAGEYEGVREILGRTYPNLYEEYASSVARGVAAYYGNVRRLSDAS